MWGTAAVQSVELTFYIILLISLHNDVRIRMQKYGQSTACDPHPTHPSHDAATYHGATAPLPTLLSPRPRAVFETHSSERVAPLGCASSQRHDKRGVLRSSSQCVYVRNWLMRRSTS